MEVFSRKLALYLVTAIMVKLLCNTECREPVLHRVGGGKYTWSPSYNFTAWASHEQFYVGDWLYFGFNKTLHNVLEVNKTSYENCIDRDFITNITRGGRDVFNLTEAREYYFLCGRGHCDKGLKVAVNVQNAPPEQTNQTLPPQMAVSNATSNTHHAHHFLPLLFVLVWICLFKYT